MTEVFLRQEFIKSIRSDAVKKDLNLQAYSFFDLLQTATGLNVLQSWFSAQAGTEIEEYNFKKVLSAMCTRITDVDSWDIFDSFTMEPVVTFREFCFIVFLFAAAESQQTKALLYMHGASLYSLLAGKETNEITSERMLRLGRFIGHEERFLLSKLRELNLTTKSKVNFDVFQLYYFDIFSEWDYKAETQPKEEEEPMEKAMEAAPFAPPPVQTTVQTQQIPMKKKKKTTGCRSKLCTLL